MRRHPARIRAKRLRSHRLDDSSDDEEAEAPNVPSRRGNCIFFHCPVNRKTVLCLVSLLAEVAASMITMRCKQTVWLYIHSEGGDLYAGISAMSHIRQFPGTVHTVVDGFVASAATLMLLAGRRRHIHVHSGVLIHQLTTGFWGGKYEDLKDEYRTCERLMQQLKTIYVTHTQMPDQIVNDHLKSEIFLDAAECIKYNIVQEIIKPPRGSVHGSYNQDGGAAQEGGGIHSTDPSTT